MEFLCQVEIDYLLDNSRHHLPLFCPDLVVIFSFELPMFDGFPGPV